MCHLFARHQHLRGEKKKKKSILLLTFSSFAPQLDAAHKTEAGAEQRMELQREVEALKVNLEKQVGAASVRAWAAGARCCFCNESAAQFQFHLLQNALLKLNKLLFSLNSSFSE